MIKVLIVDDNQIKAKKIADVLDTIPGCSFNIAIDLVTARKELQKYYDLLILDMNLPERFNETPKESKGIEFVNEIRSSKRIKLPGHIIGFTEFENLISKYKNQFESRLLSLIKYDGKGNDWQKMLSDKIDDLIKSELQRLNSENYEFDIAFITALRTPELEALLRLDYQWVKFKIPNDSSNYFRGKIKSSEFQTLNVVATSLPQMGMVASAASTMKLISTFKPKYIIMTGVCGGINGKVNLGDIIICDLAFDFGSGKVILNNAGIESFEPDFKSIPLAGELKDELIDLATQKSVLRNIRDAWIGNEVNEINLQIGPLGSGAAVIANAAYVEKITAFQRKLLAIDMETYSIFYCSHISTNPKPKAISIKAVSDFADHNKNDNIQKYCSFITANLADYIIRNILQYD